MGMERGMEVMIKNRDGTTIVSVLVAFAILLIGIAFVYGAVLTAENLERRTADMRGESDSLISAYYKGTLTDTETSDISASAVVNGESLHFSFSIGSGVANEDGTRIYYFK